MRIKFNIKYFSIIIISVIVFIILLVYTSSKNKSETVFNNAEYRTVIVDAGHGGIDGGAVGCDGTLEKDINLQISHKLSAILKLYGFNVIMTRNDDNSIHSKEALTTRQIKVSDIHNREKIIINNPNAIFVSIHQNKFQDSTIHGTQVFYSKNNPLSSALALKIQDSIVENTQKDNCRKIKQSGTEIYLLYHSQIPSVMVECGFVSNQSELNKLKSDEYQKKIALSIADGILNYYKEQDESYGTKR